MATKWRNLVLGTRRLFRRLSSKSVRRSLTDSPRREPKLPWPPLRKKTANGVLVTERGRITESRREGFASKAIARDTGRLAVGTAGRLAGFFFYPLGLDVTPKLGGCGCPGRLGLDRVGRERDVQKPSMTSAGAEGGSLPCGRLGGSQSSIQTRGQKLMPKGDFCSTGRKSTTIPNGTFWRNSRVRNHAWGDYVRRGGGRSMCPKSSGGDSGNARINPSGALYREC